MSDNRPNNCDMHDTVRPGQLVRALVYWGPSTGNNQGINKGDYLFVVRVDITSMPECIEVVLQNCSKRTINIGGNSQYVEIIYDEE